MNLNAVQWEVLEWGYESSRLYEDPFNSVELDVLIRYENGLEWRVPAFWEGGQGWRVRFAPPLNGQYAFETICSDEANESLHGLRGEIQALPYQGEHRLRRHGLLEVSQNQRYFEFSDGTPFYWLGDTWWMGLCKRLSWPDDFQLLAADRKEKGFTLVQIVAGLYPDMPGFDPRGANEAGFPWEEGYARINPAYFDMADLRIRWLVRQELMPCIVGCWGYYLPILGIKKMKRHWRYLVARWGAYPVIWCLAGEACMPYYLSKDKKGDEKLQIEGWTELAQFVRQLDPHQRLITIHPTQVGRDQLLDDSSLDINMLQTGHGGYGSVSNTITRVREQTERNPHMPVVVGEVSYEGILHDSGAEMQRLVYWSAVLSGASGYTYGANGIWQVNARARPYGPSPHGASWGNTPWEDAYRLEGSTQVGLARRLLERYEWWRFEPHPEWTDPSGSPEKIGAPFAAGIPGIVRVIYFYSPTQPWSSTTQVCRLEDGLQYQAYFWDPRTGQEYPLGEVKASSDGNWLIPIQPEMKDWVLVLERAQ
jgi:hypothetical protein